MKDDILRELKSRQGEYISGEEISSKFQVSRTAIWKYMNQLKNMGYVIESQTKKGYKLVGTPDSLLPYEIKEKLITDMIGTELQFLEQVDSTNLYAKRVAEQDFPEGTVILADEQTKGKGRLGRTWVSPKGKGIWMSIMLKPKLSPADAAKVTLLAACSVCKAIEDVGGISPKIKWPNDIVMNGKKICGILTEMSAELDAINYLIVGIGINVNIDFEEFPVDLQTMASSIKIEKGSEVSRKDLVAAILNNFEQYYKVLLEERSISAFMNEYKEKSAVLGKEVNVISSTMQLRGVVSDISSEGQLILRLEDGSCKEIISGEVSVRGLNGYI